MKEGRQRPLFWICGQAKAHAGSAALLAAVSGGAALSFILLALASSAVLDIATGHRAGSIGLHIGYLVGLIVLQVILVGTGGSLRTCLSGKLEMSMRKSLFTALTRKEYARLSDRHSSELVGRLAGDVQVVAGGIVSIMTQATAMGTRLAAGFAVLLRISPALAWGLGCAGLLVYAAGRVHGRRSVRLHKGYQAAEDRVRAFVQEYAENMAEMKTFAKEEGIDGRLTDLQEACYQAKVKRNQTGVLANMAFTAAVALSYFGTLAWGALQIAKGSITFGALTACLQIMEQIRAPMRNMSGLMPQYYAMLASAERLMELQRLPEEPAYNPLLGDAGADGGFERIRLDRVSFGYGTEPVLDKVNMTIHRGEYVGIAGASGTGKSTLLKLMLGLQRPEEGEVCVETADRCIQAGSQSRRLFAYVSQSPMTLSGTIRENMTLFASAMAMSDQKLEQALRAACLWEEVSRMQGGLDARLGERGYGLSEGQIQRLAIARALLSGAPILLLDECTSALDERTEREVLRRLRLVQDKTVVYAAHHRAVLDSCDRVIDISSNNFQAKESCYGA